MKRSKIIYLLCILISNKLSAQNVELYFDTINIISIKKIDTTINVISESSKLFFFNNTYYQANNYPFEVLRTKCSITQKNNMFYAGYSPITNTKSINKLNRKINKKKYLRCDGIINKSKLTKRIAVETIEIFNCLRVSEDGVFLISDQKALAAFLIIDCGFEGGTHDAIFCKDKLNISKTPVLLNVVKIIK